MSLAEGFASRLADGSTDLRAKINVVTELREVVEVHQVAPDHDGFMSVLLPEMLRLLEQVPVSMQAASAEHKLRRALLDVLIRLKPNEALKPAVPAILRLLMAVIEQDNEDNGVVALKAITNMHRAYTTQLDEFVQPFFDLVIKINGNMPALVEQLFGSAQQQQQQQQQQHQQQQPGTPQQQPSTPSGLEAEKSLLPAMHSFKVLTECPIIVVCMYSTNRSLISRTLPMFISHLIETLSLEAAAQAKEHQAAAAKGEHFCGVAPAIRHGPHRQAFSDFVMAQIKITSFLAYALRAFTGALHQHYTLVPNFVVRLLKDCPPEMSAARKELLVSMRHILSTDFRTFFIAKVSTLLEDKVLIGTGLTASENLRPLAYSTMADLIHHVRNELSTAQIWQTVRVFTRNLQDNSLATSFQIMSAKLLLNFMDRITTMPERAESRQILVVILRAFVDRFSQLNRQYLELTPAHAPPKDSYTLQQALRDTSVLRIHADSPNMELKDARYVFRNLVLFLKNVVYGLKTTNAVPPHDVARGFSHDEVALLRRLLREGLRGLALFAAPPNADGTTPPVSDAEKELMEAFSTVFVHLDAPTFNEVVAGEMEAIDLAIHDNAALLHWTQLLAGNEATSPGFCGIVLDFLMARLERVGSGDPVAPRLFRQCFGAVNLFPAANESVILPHLRDLVMRSLDLARDMPAPELYFGLLQQLFRNLGGGRFDAVYKQVLSLLQVLLETLNRRLAAARSPEDRNLYAGLCLTVPVRLSLLVPHLAWLLRPLVQALGSEATPELVAQGLRTLELCVDNLTAAWFDPIIEPVLPEVMAALWTHLRPLPYDHKLAHATLRVLGKLGGRNRAGLAGNVVVHPRSALDQDLAAVLDFGGPVPVRVTPSVAAALRLVHSPHAAEPARKAGLDLVTTVLLKHVPSGGEFGADPRGEPLGDAAPDLDARSHAQELCEKLLEALVVGVATIEDADSSILWELVDHLVLLELGEHAIERRRALRPFDLGDGEGAPHVTPRTLLTAVISALSHPAGEVRQTGADVIRRIGAAGRVLCPGTASSETFRYPMMRGLFARLSHSCFEAAWATKAGAVRGLRIVVGELGLPAAWLEARQVELARTLFFVIKDSANAPEAPSALVRDASDLLLAIVRGGPVSKTGALDASNTSAKGVTSKSEPGPGSNTNGSDAKLNGAEPGADTGATASNATDGSDGGANGANRAAETDAKDTDTAMDVDGTSGGADANGAEPTSNHLNATATDPKEIPIGMRPGERPFVLLTSLLAYELESAARPCRETAQKALQIVADRSGLGVGAILGRVTDVFLTPILMKPLRALPFATQIGYIDAVAFCLSLRDSFLVFNDKLLRLLDEAWALVDAEDESLASAHRVLELATSQQLAELRVVCIRLLALAATTSDHLQTTHPAMRAKIVAVFFKTLSSPCEPAVAAAHDALRRVLEISPRLPKDLLQNGLRPILVNLSDHRRLTPACLGGLARLLELLTYYFKVEIGKKLLDHLRAWTEPAQLAPVAGRALAGDERVRVGVAILDVFHLLPPTAHMFIPVVMDTLLDIERTLRRVHDSPFRAPVARFVDRHSPEAFAYFAGRLADPVVGRLFAFLVGSAPALRSHVRAHLSDLSGLIVGLDRDVDQCVGVCNLIFVVAAAGDPEWLRDQRTLLLSLVSSVGDVVQAANTLPPASPLHLTVAHALDELQNVIIAAAPDAELLLLLVGALAAAGIDPAPGLQDWLWDFVANSAEPPFAFLEIAVGALARPGRTWAVQGILLCLVAQIRRHGSLEHMAGTWLQLVHTRIWQNAGHVAPPASLDKTQIATLELSMLLVRHAPTLVADARKDVIKYGWAFIKVDDVVSKAAAHVLVAQFIAVFDTLPKIVTQIYAALLKTAQAEARALVHQGLDILGEVLEQRIQGPLWAKWPRRVMGEDGHIVTAVAGVCLFVCRHARLFYPFRELYVPYLLSAIVKLSYVPAATLDVDLAALLATWADMRASDTTGYTMPQPQRETLVTYLVRYVCTQTTPVRDSSHGRRVLDVMNTLLKVWDVEVRLDFFDRALVQADLTQQNAIPPALNALEVIRLALIHGRAAATPAAVAALLDKALLSTSLDIHERLVPVLEASLPGNEPLLRSVVAALNEHLGATAPPAGWALLGSAAQHADPTALDPLLPAAVKALGRSSRDPPTTGNGSTNGTATTAPGSGAAESRAPETTAPATADKAALAGDKPSESALLLTQLDVVGGRISHLGDQRRAFLTFVAQLVDRAPVNIAKHVLGMVRQWVFSHGQELFPTTKEKAALLHKLLVFRDRPELDDLYFQLVLDVFEDQELRKTELPARLEQPFLAGCAHPSCRDRFLAILGGTLEMSAGARLAYVFTEQNWEALADRQWLAQALALVLGALHNPNAPLDLAPACTYAPVAILGQSSEVPEDLKSFLERRKAFLARIAAIPASRFVKSLQEVAFNDPTVVHEAWADVLPGMYRLLNVKERGELTRGLATLLAREFHLRQADVRPNAVQTLLGAIAKADAVPPQLARFLAQNYGAWFAAIDATESLHSSTSAGKVHDAAADALAELYAALGETDAFYGLWRTRSRFTITTAALSYEQCGLWQRAMVLHEQAQIKARSGVLPFGEAEYGLWEDHWVLCAEKLQHWDVLTDIAKHEGFSDLLLECAWRQADWVGERDALEPTVKALMDAPTPRRQVFETFLVLQGLAHKAEPLQRLSQACDEGLQLALRRWHALPERPTAAHIPLLHTFQQYVEFMEASQVYTSLGATTALNLEAKSNELKGVLSAWHDRLPTAWDDITLWGDLATWRQHVFNVINRVYLPLIPQLAGPGANNSAAYRGYHEIAWMINRFAHVARKHGLPDVCVSLLSRIYQLPNIEIQEAFLKLREQAKCHLQNPAELQTGLEVISNTNLAYFGNAQKSEFFALKGMSLARLGAEDHANEAFSTAVQIDVYLPKAWAEWGAFNDRRFKHHPDNTVLGSAAVVCYLHAAGLYKNAKCRKILGRLLWLLSVDDAQGSIAQAFDNFKGDTPTWYWVTYVPQLLTALSRREARFAARILGKIAKMYPQALHFHLRTAREEYVMLQRVRRVVSSNTGAMGSSASANSTGSGSSGNGESGTATGSIGSLGSGAGAGAGAGYGSNNNAATGPGSVGYGSNPANPGTGGPNAGSNAPSNTQSGGNSTSNTPDERGPLDYIEEIMSVLKTAYPLLALSLETLIDQMYHRFKSPPDEDAYRLIVALLNDGLTFMGRQQSPRPDLRLPPQTEANVSRFAEGVMPDALRPAFERDFVHAKPDLDTYIARLRVWRDRLEAKLDARPPRINLEALSPPLSEFHYQKFEDVEVPGQNMELRDSNAHHLKIGRFLPSVDHVRSFGICYRRITIQATDGSLHPFAVQWPAARHCRREERMSQVFKILNSVVARRPEARKNGLQFTLPVAVPLNTHIRLVQDDPAYRSFYQIYERFCRSRGQSRDAPFDYTEKKIREAFDPRLPKPDLPSLKMEILAGVQATLVPPTIMRDFFTSQYAAFEDFWRFRKQFAYQYAGVTFMTIMMSVNNRYPHKFLVNLASGAVWATEMLPILPPNKTQPTFLNGEPVAFRLTPNLQTLLGPTMMEGVFAMTVMVLAKGLTEPEFDLESYLPVFVRDELVSTLPQQQRSLPPAQVREIVRINVEAIARRASSLAQIGQGTIPANQTVIDLVSLAVNPRNLALTEILWMPYY